MLLLAVDPGVRGCGCALFLNGRLIACDHVLSGSKAERGGAWVSMALAVKKWAHRIAIGHMLPPAIDRLVVEMPVVYPHGPSGKKAGTDPNDLIALAAVVGALCLAFDETVEPINVYAPREWKGQIPKIIHHQRALARLDAEELAHVPKLAKSRLHNALDGMALGLTDLGRLGNVPRDF